MWHMPAIQLGFCGWSWRHVGLSQYRLPLSWRRKVWLSHDWLLPLLRLGGRREVGLSHDGLNHNWLHLHLHGLRDNELPLNLCGESVEKVTV